MVPLEALTQDGSQILENIIDITACAKDGKLMLLLTGESPSDRYLSVLVSMDPDRNFEILGSQANFTAFSKFGTLVSDGCDLYLVGGAVKRDPENIRWYPSKQICRLVCSDSKEITAEAAGEMIHPRMVPRASCSNGTILLANGYAADETGGAMCQPAPGAEQYAIGANKSEMIDLNSISDD